ncbi:hypothetical protein [Kocuria sabuli]|uniref:hypothetical protein n=1 Tax=Kocuria sabuli TaxID=3071448 RepID=UPI0034D78D8E
MITAERLEAITRFHGLLQVAVAEGAEPLTELQRQVWIDMVGELIEHAKETVTT